MHEKRWHERRHKRYHWLRDREGRWHPEAFEYNGESMVTMISKLMDAILDSWTHCLLPPYGSGQFTPEDGQTDCNGFVNMVAEKMGCHDLKPEGARWPLRANEMHDKLVECSTWNNTAGPSAQFYANHGYLVIAAWKNSDPEKSGHVAVVRPGTLGTSGKWRHFIPKVPKVANVGSPSSCRVDRGSNWAFNHEPNYFVWLEGKK